MATRQVWNNASTAISDTTKTEILHVFGTTTGHKGATFYVYSSAILATASVEYIEPGGTARVLATETIPAGGTEVTAMDFDFAIPEAKLYITLDSASASTITAEAVVY